MKTRSTLRVTAVFPIKERGWLVAHLDPAASADWDWKSFGPVDLRLGEKRLRMRYAGSGTACRSGPGSEDIPFLILVPADARYTTIDDVERLIGETSLSRIYVERVSDTRDAQ